MTESKKIVILTADAGFGHRSTANAIAAALEERWGDECQVVILNALDDERAPSILRDSQADYDRLVRETPELYKLRYEFSEQALPNAVFEMAITAALYNVISDLITAHRPDVLVLTHPMYPSPVAAVVAASGAPIPIITVVTDFTEIHRSWLNSSVDLCLVPNRAARDRALEFGFSEGQVQVTGIPVHPDMVREQRSKAEIRRELGWDERLPAVLFIGSKRVKNLEPFLHIFNHSGLPMQMVVVAGGDDDLYQRQSETEWHSVAHVYNYIENMPVLMHASDAVVSKAGGLIVSESLACGLPMLFVDVTPGQEMGNVEYVIKNGAGERVDDPIGALETLAHWLVNNQAVLRQYQVRALEAGRPESAYTVADLAMSAAQRGPVPAPLERAPALAQLFEGLRSLGLGKSDTRTANLDTPPAQ